MAAPISRKRKCVAQGVFKAELNEFLTRELAEDGYSGVEVRTTPGKTEIIIMATRTQNVLGEKGKRIRELTSVVQKRFSFPEGSVELYAEKVATRGLCAIAQAESLRFKLIGGLAVRRACYGVLRFIMESGAKGCEVVVSGKLRGQRAKAMKFVDGLMIHSGEPVNDYVSKACRHVLLRQGVLGIKVKIMLDWDPTGKTGPKNPLPDNVQIVEPKEEIIPAVSFQRSPPDAEHHQRDHVQERHCDRRGGRREGFACRADQQGDGADASTFGIATATGHFRPRLGRGRRHQLRRAARAVALIVDGRAA